MKAIKLLLAAWMVTGVVDLARADSAVPYCASGKKVTIAGLQWESASFITEVMKIIIGSGYQCEVDQIPGETLMLEHAVTTGDIQIFAEQWINRSGTWTKALAAGSVENVGHPFPYASEGWFVPEFVVKGDSARGIAPVAPDLRRVDQLSDPKYIAIFADQEEPDKGRLLNCQSGSNCEGVNTKKLEAYGLNKTYVNFRPGSQAADAEITSAILQGRPILFYYWSPSAIMGKYKFIKLEEPPFSEECWKTLTTPDAPKRMGCSFPESPVVYGVNSAFAKEAPQIVDMMTKATFPVQEINAVLASMSERKIDAATAAREFLQSKPDIWGAWVDPETKARIEAALK